MHQNDDASPAARRALEGERMRKLQLRIDSLKAGTLREDPGAARAVREELQRLRKEKEDIMSRLRGLSG